MFVSLARLCVVYVVKPGSQYDARLCVSLRCVSALYCEDDALLLTPSDAT